MQSQPKRTRPGAPPAHAASGRSDAAPAAGFRTLTGVIVTLLLLALVALIATTLLRFPVRRAAATPAAQTTIALPPSATPAQAAALLTPGAPLTPAEPLTPTATLAPPAASAALTQTAPLAPIAAPAAPTDTPPPPGPLPLPTPDAAAAPAAPFQLFANANYVYDLAFDSGSLWAATSGGALRWDTTTATATTFSGVAGLQPGPLTAVTVCPITGFGVVFGSSSGLQVYDPATDRWKQVVGGGAALRFSDVAALACDAEQGILAVGYAAHGVDVFRTRPGRWSYTAPGDGLFAQGAPAVAIGPNATIWAASGDTLVQIQGAEVTTFTPNDSPLGGAPLSALQVDPDDGALWISAGSRLLRLLDGNWQAFSADRSSGDFPRAALADVAPAQGGRAWLLSEDAELCRFDPEFESCAPFYAAAGDPANAVGMAAGPATALAAGANGALAYGTAGQGSSLLARGAWTLLAQPAGFPAGNRIFALASDVQGFLWAATSAGVQQADPARPTTVAYRYTAAKDGVSATNVRTLYADARGGVWLGGIGASYFDGKRWTNYTQADGLAGDEITAIAEDSQGRIWFGTRTGLSIWTGTTFFNLTGENGLPDSEILALAADGAGMWIGSASGGLYRFESNQLQVLTAQNVGLPSNRVTALLVTADGSTLVGTDQGLARFTAGEVTAVAGLDGARITALAAAADGRVWVGTADQGAFVAADGQTFAALEASAALPPAVRALTVDHFGGAWIGGDSGLARVTP